MEGNNVNLIVALMSVEYILLLFFKWDWNLVITQEEIKFGEKLKTM